MYGGIKALASSNPKGLPYMTDLTPHTTSRQEGFGNDQRTCTSALLHLFHAVADVSLGAVLSLRSFGRVPNDEEGCRTQRRGQKPQTFKLRNHSATAMSKALAAVLIVHMHWFGKKLSRIQSTNGVKLDDIETDPGQSQERAFSGVSRTN